MTFPFVQVISVTYRLQIRRESQRYILPWNQGYKCPDDLNQIGDHNPHPIFEPVSPFHYQRGCKLNVIQY
jgi:hypothetical protein